MNPDQAKEILLLYRRGAAAEPELGAALELARADEGLRHWFDAHCAAQEKLRHQFTNIAVPEGLREQIIAERPAAAARSFSFTRVVVMCAVASAVIYLGSQTYQLISDQVSRRAEEREARRFTNYSAGMILSAINAYGMDLTTNGLPAIRDYLAAHKSPADYVLPPGLDKATPTGCVAASWHGRPVAMICFRAPGAAAGTGSDLWFFVVNRELLGDPPQNGTPQFSIIAGVPAASWSAGKQTYLLALQGDVGRLKTILR